MALFRQRQFVGGDPKYGEKIFVIFQRLSIPAKLSYMASDLAVRKKLVECTRRMWVMSERGEGTVPMFIIPVGAQPAHADARVATATVH